MKGYVPLDGMVWKWLEPAEEQKETPAAPAGTDDSDPWEGSFQAVKTRRRAPRSAYRNHCPNPPPLPHSSFITSVTFTSYHADLLALRLKLPVGLLPLLAALVGNDYHQFSHLFHTKGTSGSQKIERVALALREALDPKIAARRAAAASAVKTFQNGRLIMTQGPKSSTTPINGSAPTTPPSSGDAAASLLTSTVQSLLLHPATEPQLDKLVHNLIDSALSYSVTHDLSTTSSFSLVTPSSFPTPTPTRDEIVALYAEAMSKGDFAPKLAGVVRDGRYLGRVFLEDTQRGTIGRRVGEPIREMCWAILNQGVGIGYGKEVVVVEEEEVEEEGKGGKTLEETKSEGAAEEEEDEDEDKIIEVAEEAFASDDPEDQVPAASEDEDEEEVELPPSVQTYLRSSSLILPKMIAIPSIEDILLPTSSSSLIEVPNPFLPLVLQPVEYRTQLYLALLNSLTPSVLSLRDQLKPLVLALRWTMQVLSHDADVAAGGAKWMLRRGEVEAVVLAGVRSVRAWETWTNGLSPSTSASDETKEVILSSPSSEKLEITNRAVHITSHLLHSLHELSLLAQTLLLPSTLLPPPHRSYSGRTFHTLLASPTTTTNQFLSEEEKDDFDASMEAVLDAEGKGWLAPELEVAVDSAQARKDRKKAKKEKKRAGEAEGGGGGKKSGGGGGGGGMFAGLMEEDC